MREINRILDYINLGIEIWRDIDRRVGDDERLRIARNVHNEAMANATLSANSAMRGNNGTHEFVGMETSLHQGVRATRGDFATAWAANHDCAQS